MVCRGSRSVGRQGFPYLSDLRQIYEADTHTRALRRILELTRENGSSQASTLRQ